MTGPQYRLWHLPVLADRLCEDGSHPSGFRTQLIAKANWGRSMSHLLLCYPGIFFFFHQNFSSYDSYCKITKWDQQRNWRTWCNSPLGYDLKAFSCHKIQSSQTTGQKQFRAYCLLFVHWQDADDLLSMEKQVQRVTPQTCFLYSIFPISIFISPSMS